MSDEKKNGVASAADFRRLAESAESFEPEERVVLPGSGLAVILRRPRPIFFALMEHPLPQGLAARINPADPESIRMDQSELIGLARFWTETYCKVFVKPRLSLNPGPDEINPGWLVAADAEFLRDWVVGLAGSDGTGLTRFRGGAAGPVADSGADGQDVQPETLAIPDGNNTGLPN